MSIHNNFKPKSLILTIKTLLVKVADTSSVHAIHLYNLLNKKAKEYLGLFDRVFGSPTFPLRNEGFHFLYVLWSEFFLIHMYYFQILIKKNVEKILTTHIGSESLHFL